MLDGTRGVIDLRWDDPSYLTLNSRFKILGVNVYRSFDSEFGPYHRITELPVGSTFWRDQTDNELIPEEDVTNQFIMSGTAGTGMDGPRYVFKTLHFPIVGEESRGIPTKIPTDVLVFVDGVQARVMAVNGQTGEVELDANIYTDTVRQQRILPVLPTNGSRVTCAYRYCRDFLKTDLSQRIFYRVTTVGIPASHTWEEVNPNNLVETPLEAAAATNTFEIEKLDYIWREAIRRNRWILEQGGERVRVYLRKVVGLPCMCVDQTHKQPISDCLYCFAPGNLIRTSSGYLPIEQIRVGDRVLTSDGSYQLVLETMRSPFEGNLISIFPSVSSNPILVTPDHPFLSLVGKHEVPVDCGPHCDSGLDTGDTNLKSTGSLRQLPSGRWWARIQMGGRRGFGRKSLGTFPTEAEASFAISNYRSEHSTFRHNLEWVDASTITSKSWLTSKWPSEVVDVEGISIPDRHLKTSVYGPSRIGPTKFRVDSEFLWVIGLYLAEGSCAKRSLSFSLHSKEVEFQDRLRSYFEPKGFTVSLSPGPGLGVSVLVHSANLASWFPTWLGRGCSNKHIPEELMYLPVDKIWSLLQGIHDGDGSKSAREITQTSELLAIQIMELLHRVGEQPLLRRQRSNKLTPKGNKRKLAYCTSWGEDTLTHTNRKGRWKVKGEILSRVRSVTSVPYSGWVYNLRVAENPTYVVNGIVVHNCFGTGILGGYEGPYGIIIGPDDSEVKLSQRDTGRTTEHSYEVWTGPQPLLSHKDFVMKINGDRYSIGPVRMPTNRGVLLQQHFTIGSFDDKDIRYKVPVTEPIKFVASQFVASGPEGEADWGITERSNIPDERQLRGRSKAWSNSSY
jgi:hypothetical protein